MHVIAGLDSAHGGPSYTVPRLCQALVAAGVDAQLLSVAAAKGCDVEPDGESVRCFRPDWASVPVVRQLRCSSGLTRALRELAPKADVIHNHGLWLMPNVKAGRAALLARKPFDRRTAGNAVVDGARFFAPQEACRLGSAAGRCGSPCLVHSCDERTGARRNSRLRTPKSDRYDSEWNRYSRAGQSFDGRDRRWSDCIVTWADSSEKGIGPSGASLGTGRSRRIPTGGCVLSAPTNSVTPGNLLRWPRN